MSLDSDLTIVGAGPAGLSAAINAALEGLSVNVIERGRIGGQASASSRIENYPGHPGGISGWSLADDMRRQATEDGAQFLTGRAVKLEGTTITLEDGRELTARNVVLATGLAYSAPGWASADCHGLLVCQTPKAPALHGQHVAIVGGANSAGQAALYCARHADSTTLLVRHGLETSDYLTRRLESSPVKVCEGTSIERLILAHGRLLGADCGTAGQVACSRLLVFTGSKPDTAWLADSGVTLDNAGYVACEGYRTGAAHVWAIGDVVANATHRVAAAVGAGSNVVADILHS